MEKAPSRTHYIDKIADILIDENGLVGPRTRSVLGDEEIFELEWAEELLHGTLSYLRKNKDPPEVRKDEINNSLRQIILIKQYTIDIGLMINLTKLELLLLMVSESFDGQAST